MRAASIYLASNHRGKSSDSQELASESNHLEAGKLSRRQLCQVEVVSQVARAAAVAWYRLQTCQGMNAVARTHVCAPLGLHKLLAKDETTPPPRRTHALDEQQTAPRRAAPEAQERHPKPPPPTTPGAQSFYIETRGCQMNVSDTEVVRTLLNEDGLREAESAATADVVLLNTCAIRDKAEQKVWTRLRDLRGGKERRARPWPC